MAAEGTRLGTGFVEVTPDFSRFQELLGKRLAKALGDAKLGDRLGRSVGKELADSVGLRVRRATKGTRSDMFGLADAINRVERESRKAGRASKGLERDMFGVNRAAKNSGRSLRSARTQLRDWHSESRATSGAANRLTDRVRSLGTQLRALRRDSDGSRRPLTALGGSMGRVNTSFRFFKNILRSITWPLLIASVGLAAQGLSALAAGAVAATSALGPLVGSLVALPAAALAAAQAIGTLKLATAGVGDAIKASLDAEVQGGEQAVDTMRRQQDAAEQVADAKRNLASVQRQAHFAQEDLTEARRDATRELEDMREAADRSHESEEQGALALRQARQELNRTLNDVDATGLDIRLAESDVDSARADLQRTRTDAKRARQDFRDAQKQGVEGMPQVVAAKRAEEDATRAVQDAQRGLARATRDSTVAMEEQGSAATSLQEKMAQLPMAARAFVREIVGLKPKLDALRSTAASGFFPGATKGLHALLKNFGPVKAIVGETAQAFGNLAERAGKQLGSAEWGRDLRKLGKGNTRLLERMGEATMNLADGFRHILVAAQPFLDWLGESTVNFTEWIEESAEAGRETGRLADFFDRVREAMELTGPVLKGVGGALLGIGQAARPVGNEILESLGDAAEGWREWTESTEGQNNLRRYFRESKPAIDEMGRLLRDVGKAFFELGRQSGVAELLRLVRVELLPAMVDLFGASTGFAADFLEDLGKLRKDGVPTFEAFVRVLAEHAGEAGFKIARALVLGFINAGIWGKIAIGAFFLSKFGALSAFGNWGARAGGRLGKSLFQSAIAWIAGTQAGSSLLGWFQGTFSRSGRFGKAASTAGMRMGTLLSRGLVAAVLIALAALEDTIAKATREHIIGPVQREIEDKLGPIGSVITDVQDFIGKNFPEAAPGGPTIRKMFGGSSAFDAFEIPAPKTDKAEARAKKFADVLGREGRRGRKGFREPISKMPQDAERSGKGVNQQMLPRLDHLADEGGQKGATFNRRLSGSFRSLDTNVGSAVESIMDNTGRALKRLGVKGALQQFAAQRADFVYGTKPTKNLAGEQRGGTVAPALATGGLASVVPGNLTGDRHVLSLNGEPVAKVESKEGIFVGNRKMMGALGKLNERFPRFQKGGMLGLQRGGYPMVSGDTDFLPALGFSLSKMARALERSIFVQSGRRTYSEQAALYAKYGPGRAAPPGSSNHEDGTAGDITPGREVFGSASSRFGLGFPISHEPWHIELLNAALGARGAGAALAPKLKRMLLSGPKGPLKRLGQSAIDKVRNSAQKFLDKHASFGGFGGSGGGPWEQVLRQIAEARGWSVADWMELVMRESGGDPSAVNPTSGAYGLGQFLGSTKDAYAKYGAASPRGTDQIRAMGKYIGDRYGTPTKALAFHSANNWYKGGGPVKSAAMKLGGMLNLPGLQAGGGVAGLTRGFQVKDKFKAIKRQLTRVKGFGLSKGRFGALDSLSGQVETFSEFADNAQSLTITDEDGNSILGEFRGVSEAGWLKKSLSALGSLRNQLIFASEEIMRQRAQVQAMIERAKERLKALAEGIKRESRRRRKLVGNQEQARRVLVKARDIKDPKRRRQRIARAQGTIFDLSNRIGALDLGQRERVGLRKRVAGLIPKLTERRTSLEETSGEISGEGGSEFFGLRRVQGLDGPLNIMAKLPNIGALGGEIGTVQGRLRQIGEEATASASTDDAGSEERASLLEELLRQANQRTAVEARLGETLQGFEATYPRYFEGLTKFHSGGEIIGPANREVPIMAQVGETMLTKEERAALESGKEASGGGSVVIEQLTVYEDGSASIRMSEREEEARIEKVVRKTRGTGRATPSGTRF